MLLGLALFGLPQSMLTHPFGHPSEYAEAGGGARGGWLIYICMQPDTRGLLLLRHRRLAVLVFRLEAVPQPLQSSHIGRAREQEQHVCIATAGMRP